MTGTEKKDFRSGYVALIGRPNAGKSTLLNTLLGQHLAIVTPKPQTTRHRILGILNGADHQVLFLDTPGILDPKYALQQMMKREITRALADADVVLAVIDATAPVTDDLTLVATRPTVIAINKVDAVAKPELLPIAQRCAELGLERIYMISALRGDGVEELKTGIISLLPVAPPLYPPDIVSVHPERFFAAELIREAIFTYYGAEIPYSTTVMVEEWQEKPESKDYIRAVIYVERESQKGIIIGDGGRALKKVGSTARLAIEQFVGRPVYLELWVKVAKGWRQNENFIRRNVYGATSPG